MVNKVRVTIAGAPYAIATTDTENYITTLAKKLDDDITKLLDNNGNLSVTKAAVFCAMDYLDEYRKSAGSAENMRSQIQDYIADAARAKLAEDKAKAENEVLRREAAALREQLEKMRNKEARREERAAQQAAAKEEIGKPFPFEDDLRVKSARLVELDTLLNIDGKGHTQPETVVAKSARPSVLDSLKRPVPPRSLEKKPKQHEEVR